MTAVFRCLLLMFLKILIQNSSWAQDITQPFEHVQLQLSFQQNINENEFHNYWDSNPALQLNLVTPFYTGDFFVGGRYTSFTHRTPQVPDFDNIQISTSWGLKYEVFNGLKAGATAGILFSMAFYEKLTEAQFEWARDNFGSTSPENETGFIFGANLSYDIHPNWGIHLEWSRNIIYTSKKLKLNYVGIGLYRNFDTPARLQQILK